MFHVVTLGSFVCSCDDGYGGDGFTCRDIDECSGNHACDLYAISLNSKGSYNCDWNAGYTANGLTSDDVNECSNANASCYEAEGS